jgi:hypothetical protein
MPVIDYFETLDRFGLLELKSGGDLQIKDGDIAITRDGDLKLGDDRFNALFRLVQRWRLNESAIGDLFANTEFYAQRLTQVMGERSSGRGPSLGRDPEEFHEMTDVIGESESGASVFAGSILVVMNNLLQRFKLDLNVSREKWCSSAPLFSGHSLGEIVAAAAANFRHHDEWASSPQPNSQQMASMNILAPILGVPPVNERGFRTIRSNVCREILEVLSAGSVEQLHSHLFEFAKNLGNTQKK